MRAALLGLAAANAEGAHADELRIRAAEALCLAGSFRDVEAALAGLESEDTELRSLAGLFRARARWEAGDADAYRRELGEALAAVAGSGSRVEARLKIEAVRLPLMLDNNLEVALEQAEEAVTLARAAAVDEARALNLLGITRHFLKGEGWEQPFTEAIRVAREHGDALTELYAANNLVSGYEAAGEPAQGRAIAAAASARAVELGLVSLRRQLDASAIGLDFHAGEYERVIDQGEALLLELVEPLTIGQHIAALALAHLDCGGFKRAAELVDQLATGPSDAPGASEIVWVQAELELWSGRPGLALEHAEIYVALSDLTNDHRLLGHATRAWALADLEREPTGELPESHLPLTAPVPAEIEGLRLLVRGEPAEAARLLVEAADGYRGKHLRGELRTLYAAGEAMRRAGDLAGGRELLFEVERRAESHGMTPLLARVHRSLRLLGERRAAPRGTGDALTPRERELLVLVGEGLSNAEIARRLGLARRTVETGLRAASAKLGASSRAQAAVLANRG